MYSTLHRSLSNCIPFFFLAVALLLTKVVTWRTKGSNVFSTDIVLISRFFGSLQIVICELKYFKINYIQTYHRAAMDPTISASTKNRRKNVNKLCLVDMFLFHLQEVISYFLGRNMFR